MVDYLKPNLTLMNFLFFFLLNNLNLYMFILISLNII